MLNGLISSARLVGGDGDIQLNPRMDYPMDNLNNNISNFPRPGSVYSNNYYSNQLQVPYNISKNKEKDQKSKLAFYITIELELFPGTSANMLERSMVRCQNSFERIREAWADIFGFEYRPSQMNEAYLYNLENDKKTHK